MVELMLPKADRPSKGRTWPRPANAKRLREYHIYRYDPDQSANPRIDTYFVDLDDCGPMILDGLLWIARHVEGPVACRRHIARADHERRHRVLVDRAVRPEAPEHDPRRTRLLAGADVVGHRLEFPLRVEKISAPRPDDHVDRDFEHLAGVADRAEARRNAALEKARAELDPVGAGLGGGNRPVDAFDADFDDRLHAPQSQPDGTAARPLCGALELVW